MDGQDQPLNNQDRDWERVDARILGQILAALNIIVVLPDDIRIAEFYSQALNAVPGITSCQVYLGDPSAPVMPPGSMGGLSGDQSVYTITIKTIEHTFGHIVFRIASMAIFSPYIPFLDNLANHVALYLENRMQKRLLQQSRDELEEKVRKRTEELVTTNAQLGQEIRYRATAEEALGQLNKELEQRVKQRTNELEEKNTELERMNRIFVGRELRMMELKEKLRKWEQSVDP